MHRIFTASTPPPAAQNQAIFGRAANAYSRVAGYFGTAITTHAGEQALVVI